MKAVGKKLKIIRWSSLTPQDRKQAAMQKLNDYKALLGQVPG